MSKEIYDLCVIGGGINGAGIARDAAGRGLSVLLVEAGDLASATSSASTKLIHGGLRYLEYLEFRLVAESLRERETLLRTAPHAVQPLRFVLPHDSQRRPGWMIRAGLFLYDHLAGRRSLEPSRSIDLQAGDEGKNLKDNFRRGFTYADCRADDTRLVVLNAVDAAERGADILTRTACVGLHCPGNHWDIDLQDMRSGVRRRVRAAMVINAAGPWVRGVLEASGLAPESAGIPRVRLVKGSHIIVSRRYEGEHAYILQQPDKRVVFVIPYEDQYTLIGTTEEEYEGDPAAAQISEQEAAYLCRAYNSAFTDEIGPDDIIWTYSGVRPLFDDGQRDATAVTRDYRIHRHRDFAAPMISLFGGKLTTYRRLAEETVDQITLMAGKRACGWTAGHALPGGDTGNFTAFCNEQVKKYSWLPADLVRRYARAYGTRMNRFLEDGDLKSMGRHYGDHVYEAELRYLVAHEWAQSGEDVLWRRSKLGMHVSDETAREIDRAVAAMLKEKEDERINAAGD